MTSFLITLCLLVGALARAEDDSARRRELIRLPRATNPAAAPAALLVWPAPFEREWSEAERAAVVEGVLHLERESARRLGLTRVEIREALDLTLRPDLAFARAVSGRLHRFGPNRYDQAVGAELATRIAALRPALARALVEAARDFDARRQILLALDLVDWRGLRLPLTLGPRGDAYELDAFAGEPWRHHRVEALRDLAVRYLDARRSLTLARAELARLGPSPFRAAWLAAIDDVERELAGALGQLPQRIERLVELVRDRRRTRRQQEQELHRGTWERLGAEEPPLSNVTWTHVLDEISGDSAPGCAPHLQLVGGLRP